MHYIVEKREIQGLRKLKVHKAVVSASPYSVNDLVQGSEYEFRVYARNVYGISEPSEMSKSVVFKDLGEMFISAYLICN